VDVEEELVVLEEKEEEEEEEEEWPPTVNPVPLVELLRGVRILKGADLLALLIFILISGNELHGQLRTSRSFYRFETENAALY
jgi:hypothetical protein